MTVLIEREMRVYKRQPFLRVKLIYKQKLYISCTYKHRQHLLTNLYIKLYIARMALNVTIFFLI